MGTLVHAPSLSSCYRPRSLAARFGSEHEVEFATQRSPAIGCDGDGATPVYPHDPPQLEEPPRHRRTERPGKVRPPSAPVQAGPRKRALADPDAIAIDAKLMQPSLASPGDLIAVTAGIQMVAVDESLADADPQPAREVVVASASPLQAAELEAGFWRAGEHSGATRASDSSARATAAPARLK